MAPLTGLDLAGLKRTAAALAGRPAQSWLQAIAAAAGRQALAEWRGSPGHLFLLGRLRPESLGAAPRDFRPGRPDLGRAILAGRWPLAGAPIEVGPGGDPWNRASPSRRFAVELHQFHWLPDLAATGDAGQREALRLLLEWERVFGRWNSFAWSGEVIERRVFNLASTLRRVVVGAADVERSLLLGSLSRQAWHLAGLWRDPARAAERAAAVGVAGAALSGQAGEQLLSRSIDRLQEVLPRTVLADGGHASRSPEAALQLLFDLLTFDDALLQLGREPPPEVARATDRLTGALRFFTLPDGRLPCFHGGEESEGPVLEAARAHDDGDGPAPLYAPHSGYEKLIGGSMHVVVDAAAPASGPWADSACAHPLALEVACGRDRIITNTGWSPRADAAPSLRLTPAASTAAVADDSAGAPLGGFRARFLGPRLEGGARVVDIRRHQGDEGVWLEGSHDGWAARYGLTHERRLFLDAPTDELRGEDRFVPLSAGAARPLSFTVRFHIHPDVRVTLARDQRSILLQGPTAGGWWLRNDAIEVSIEPSVHLLHGRARRTSQIVLRSQIRGERGGRIRWKLARAEPEQA